MLKESLKKYKNFIFSKLGILKISSVVFVLTDRCNLRCLMCDIWQKNISQRRELSLAQVKQVLESLFLKGLKYINYTGGEPFMREDLKDILNISFSLFPKTYITISSNGTMKEEMLSFFSGQGDRIRRIFLKISIDGIGDTHDKVRQSKGSFERINHNIKMLQERYPLLDIEIKFAITPWNYYEIEKMARYCQQQKLKLFIKFIENTKAYTNNLYYEDNIKKNKFKFSVGQIKLIKEQVKRIKNLNFVNRHYLGYLIDFLNGKIMKNHCYLSQKFLFITSGGSVYTCRNFVPLGNINQTNINAILKSRVSYENIEQQNKNICNKCLFIGRF